MKKVLILVLMAALLLSGCQKQTATPATSPYTIPTLPEFDQTLTPQQHLEAAIDSLREYDFTVSYGSGWQDGLTLTTSEGEKAFSALRAMIPNDNLIERFCAMSMMVIPSNDGTFCYQVSGLSLTEICDLICGHEPTPEQQAAASRYPGMEGSVQIRVDADRIFQSLRVDIDLSGSTWSIQITFDKK